MSVYLAMAAVLEKWRGDLSYGELSRRAQLAVPTVIEVCQGRARPKPETLSALVAALGRTEVELMSEMAATAEG